MFRAEDLGISRFEWGFPVDYYCSLKLPYRAGDAKGKVERPFRQLRETFLPELEAQGPPESLDELNRRAGVGLEANVHAVESRPAVVWRYAEPPRRYVPERPPVFSHRHTSLMTMERSSDLHMS